MCVSEGESGCMCICVCVSVYGPMFVGHVPEYRKKKSSCQNRDEICHLGTVWSYLLRPLRFFWDRRTDISQSKTPSPFAGSKKKRVRILTRYIVIV